MAQVRIVRGRGCVGCSGSIGGSCGADYFQYVAYLCVHFHVSRRSPGVFAVVSDSSLSPTVERTCTKDACRYECKEGLVHVGGDMERTCDTSDGIRCSGKSPVCAEPDLAQGNYRLLYALIGAMGAVISCGAVCLVRAAVGVAPVLRAMLSLSHRPSPAANTRATITTFGRSDVAKRPLRPSWSACTSGATGSKTTSRARRASRRPWTTATVTAGAT